MRIDILDVVHCRLWRSSWRSWFRSLIVCAPTCREPRISTTNSSTGEYLCYTSHPQFRTMMPSDTETLICIVYCWTDAVSSLLCLLSQCGESRFPQHIIQAVGETGMSFKNERRFMKSISSQTALLALPSSFRWPMMWMWRWRGFVELWSRRAPDWPRQWGRLSLNSSSPWKSSKAFESFFLSSWLWFDCNNNLNSHLLFVWNVREMRFQPFPHLWIYHKDLCSSPTGMLKCWPWQAFITGSSRQYISGCRLFMTDPVTEFVKLWKQIWWEGFAVEMS